MAKDNKPNQAAAPKEQTVATELYQVFAPATVTSTLRLDQHTVLFDGEKVKLTKEQAATVKDASTWTIKKVKEA